METNTEEHPLVSELEAACAALVECRHNASTGEASLTAFRLNETHYFGQLRQLAASAPDQVKDWVERQQRTRCGYYAIASAQQHHDQAFKTAMGNYRQLLRRIDQAITARSIDGTTADRLMRQVVEFSKDNCHTYAQRDVRGEDLSRRHFADAVEAVYNKFCAGQSPQDWSHYNWRHATLPPIITPTSQRGSNKVDIDLPTACAKFAAQFDTENNVWSWPGFPYGGWPSFRLADHRSQACTSLRRTVEEFISAKQSLERSDFGHRLEKVLLSGDRQKQTELELEIVTAELAYDEKFNKLRQMVSQAQSVVNELATLIAQGKEQVEAYRKTGYHEHSVRLNLMCNVMTAESLVRSYNQTLGRVKNDLGYGYGRRAADPTALTRVFKQIVSA